MSKITLKNDTTPDTPESGKTEIFVDTVTKKIHSIDDTGTETEYGSGGGGGGSGDVVGPASAVDNNVVMFDGITGKLIKDSGLSLSGTNTGDQTSVSGNSGSTDALKSATTTIDVVSSTAPTVGQVLTATSDSAATWQDASGGGGLTPPVSSTDNAIVRWDGIGADTVQDSPVTIDDDGRIGVDGTALGNSVYIGDSAGAVDDKTANQNVGIGWHALILNTSGYFNTAIGYGSQRKTSTGRNNVSMGYQSLYNIQAAIENTGIGTYALATCTSGAGNVALGNSAGTSINSGSYNTCIGYQSLRNTTGSYNIALGWKAGYGASTVAQVENIWIGKQAGISVTTGSRNLVIGNGADIPTATTNDYMNIGDMITADMTTDVVDMANISLTNLPVYADEAAAVTGGLATDRVYKTATGELRIKL